MPGAGNLILGRLGARPWLTLIMALLGMASACTALVTDETSFVAAVPFWVSPRLGSIPVWASS